MSFEGLQERLAALQDTTAQLKELIDRLARLKFEPGSVPLTTDEENSVSGELGGEITSALRDGEEDQELLQEEVEYFRGAEHDRERLREGVEKVGKELASCRLSFRKARLSAKKSLVQAQRLERELLVQSYSLSASGASSPLPGDEKASAISRTTHQLAQHHNHQQQQSGLTEDDQQMVGASSNVTSALRRTHDLIAAELERSEYAHQTLTESSAALKQLNESYTDLDGMLASSKDLLGTLLRSQKSDTWYLQTAMYMLMVTGAWLVFRRILYGPLWWLVWLPVRILFGTGVKVGGAVMQARSVAGESGKVDVGQETQEIPVDGLPGKELPTAKVGGEAADSDSVLDDVEKIVHAVNKADELGNIPEEKDGVVDGARNTKKRMWEEAAEVASGERPKDEL
ncbi:Sec20-domain-containing protein [Dactylonectria estremocensis]|uniref:Sec20-domain-containing protein n=1 Tax=Dactylonectria estremocensis TaxID=1079267 RepID=A0A9P9FKA9_9HYPO|nr:Sec20-domain-containing protein [Dactylonectria estremocensis]